MLAAIGVKIAALRNAKGWSQQDLASKAKVARPTLADYERGESRPRAENLARLAKALGVAPEQLGTPYDPEAPRRHRKRFKSDERPADTDEAPGHETLTDPVGRVMAGDLDRPEIQEALGAFKRLTPDQQEEAIDFMRDLRRGMHPSRRAAVKKRG
jgi:transcriptional regulator with XRE-family HTH domain